MSSTPASRSMHEDPIQFSSPQELHFVLIGVIHDQFPG
ncbi:MAG: hypothetical protein ACI8RZ_006489 [Myxococcota bacterium]|jgi:hypothetical protein